MWIVLGLMWIVLGLMLTIVIIICLAFWAVTSLFDNMEDGY